MKKILGLVLWAALATSCYEDYAKDYDLTATYFAHQFDTRTLVVGEGMKIQVGVGLGGVVKNTELRTVSFTIDDALLTKYNALSNLKAGDSYMKEAMQGVSAISTLPNDYYTLSHPNTFEIKPGTQVGVVTLRVDSVKFLSNPDKTLVANYVLPLAITGKQNIDAVLEGRDYAVIGLRYDNMLFGNYWYGGESTVKDAQGNEIAGKKKTYYTRIPQDESVVWKLKTVAPFELETNRVANQAGAIRIKLNQDGTVTLSKASKSTLEVENDGVSSFNKAKLLQNRKIYLNYKLKNADGTFTHYKDTLTFRNRIRDGVNEWQDENPEHYGR